MSPAKGRGGARAAEGAARGVTGVDPALAADLGAHVSVAGGIAGAFARAAGIGAGVAQVFVKNQRQWAAKPLSEEDARAFAEAWARSRAGRLEGADEVDVSPHRVLRAAPPVASVVAHATYLVNLAAVDDAIRERSIACLADELSRADRLGIAGVIFHPGSAADGKREGIERIARAIPHVITASGARRAELILEGTAGGGGQVGSRFEELRAIIDLVPEPFRARLGVCVDTCHMHVAGYALSSAAELSALLDELDAVVGLARLRCVHVNDAKAPRGSRLDRHENIGRGTVGLACFEALVREPRLAGVPKVLETPEEDDGHARDLALLLALRAGAAPAARAPGRAAKPAGAKTAGAKAADAEGGDAKRGAARGRGTRRRGEAKKKDGAQARGRRSVRR